MTLDRQIDPITLDYVDGSAGSFAEVEVIENQIILSVIIAAQSWEGDPTVGAGLDPRAKDGDQDLQKLGADIAAALQWLIDDGDLVQVDVAVQSYTGGVVAFEVDAYRPGADQPLQLPPFLIAVGLNRGT